MVKKHAYLIMAHNNFGQLKKLLKCLDHPRNDLFIHVDKKSDCDLDEVASVVTHSKVVFTRRINVSWGGYSQIGAELILLEEAILHGTYERYHLITGVDLPLRKQQDIHNFFDAHPDVEFISGGCARSQDEQWFIDRVRYYYPLQEILPKNGYFSKVIRKMLQAAQKMIGVNRVKNTDMKFGVGSAYFDITDRFARYVVSQKETIRNRFSRTFCADELFLQWVYIHWENPNPRYVSDHPPHPYIEKTYFDVCRAIDWVRGSPYVFMRSDYQMLMESGCLFARKFDERADDLVIDMIVSQVTETEN